MAERVLPSREKWNTPHAPEYAHDIVNEMSGRERRQVALAWLTEDLMTKDEWQRKVNSDLSKWETERGV